ncbi:MAG: hypothetical protein GY945_07485 [Rhodobacteraceae bacterium]|nr:hypothetical protein [Paracoccaceae bacterium]
MIYLILGVFLWYAAHLFKRVFPAPRARMGDKGAGLVAAVLLVSIILMVIGYRGYYPDNLYTPLPGMGHLMNLIALIAIFIMMSSRLGGYVERVIRHPQLSGFALWSGAHLLVNGDLGAVILFGGLGVWALLEMVILNRASGPWKRPESARIGRDAIAAALAVAVYGAATAAHWWLGYYPFSGTYG